MAENDDFRADWISQISVGTTAGSHRNGKLSPRVYEGWGVAHFLRVSSDAAVLGKKDPSRGEVVVAFTIAREGQTIVADQLREFCREQGLIQWKIPREIFVVEDLPRSPTGKVLKRVLAEQLNAPA